MCREVFMSPASFKSIIVLYSYAKIKWGTKVARHTKCITTGFPRHFKYYAVAGLKTRHDKILYGINSQSKKAAYLIPKIIFV